MRRAAASANGGTISTKPPSGNGSKSGSPLSTTSDDEASPLAKVSAPSILSSSKLLPSVGATGVRLLQQLSGQGGGQQQQQQLQEPQQVQGTGSAVGADTPSGTAAGASGVVGPASDLGGTAVTAERAELAPSPALKNGTKN